MHQLLHLADSVKYLGPLHTFSCFDHEHSNGLLAKTVHSNCGVDKQIMSMFSYLQGMCRLSSENNVQEEWIDSILHFSRSSKSEIALLGSCDTVDNSLLKSYFTCTTSQIKRYKRMRIMHEVYHSTLYERPTKYNNTTIAYLTPGNTELSFGIISFFVATEDGEFAVVNPLIPKGTHLVNDTITHVNINHILVFHPTPGPTVIVPIRDIKSKVVYMHFSDQPQTVYIAMFPNNIEGD